MLKINLNSPVPIYEQLITEIQRMVEANELQPGDSLPTIRALASQIDVAINTVARAYQELERLGVIESNGRKGSQIRRDFSPQPKDDSRVFREQILKLLQKGMGRNEIEKVFYENLNIFFG
ncbi:GntR family transcriptional regulator [candidate division KSB1 bacterium]